MSEETKNETLALPKDVLDKLGALDQILQKDKDLEAVKAIKDEYLNDEKKKMIWEAGFGEKLEKNFGKVRDTEWIKDQLDLATERLTLKLEAAQKREEEKKEEDLRTPGVPGNNVDTPQSSNQEFNKASTEVFTNKEFLDKLTPEQRLMLEVNAPGNVPAYKR